MVEERKRKRYKGKEKMITKKKDVMEKNKYEQPLMVKLGGAVWKGTISFICVLVFGFMFINFISMITQHKDALTIWNELTELRHETIKEVEGDGLKLLLSDDFYYKFSGGIFVLCWVQQIWFWYPAKYKQYQL